MIRAGRSPNRRRHVEPSDRGEGEEEEDDGPPARRLRLDDESAWQRRLRNVVNDRGTRREPDQPVTRPNLH